MKSKAEKFLGEIKDLLIVFFRPIKLTDEIFYLPKDVRNLGFKHRSLILLSTIISLFFSFMLKATNLLIQYKFILLGLIVFMLYRAQELLRNSVDFFLDSEGAKMDLVFNQAVIFRGSKIISHVSNRVLKYDESNKMYSIMENECVSNSIKRTIQTLWRMKIAQRFEILEVVSIVLMITFAIITNNSISQYLFIPLILIFVCISFVSSAYINIQREEFQEKSRVLNNEQDIVVNDILRVPTIVKKDLDMRMSRFQKSMVESNKNIKKFYKKMNTSRIVVTFLELISQYGIIIFYLFGIKWSEVSLATIAEITANLVIVETALNYVSRLAYLMNDYYSGSIIIEKEKADVNLILDVYHKEVKNKDSSQHINKIHVSPFSIKYSQFSENDIPFELTSKNEIVISVGEVAILYGASGSGKSTFEKMITDRISLEKSKKIPSTTKFLFYDETLKFGSLSLFEELFCRDPNPSLSKMQDILENLHLWSEIQANCNDVWEWLKVKKYENSLSNGQKQRLILAKMLYWMDSDIDVLVLDEATSGLDVKLETDNADAEKILEYIVKFANKDKKRIIIISTHQDVSGFIQNLHSDYTFKLFSFEKEDGLNVIKEISAS